MAPEWVITCMDWIAVVGVQVKFILTRFLLDSIDFSAFFLASFLSTMDMEKLHDHLPKSSST